MINILYEPLPNSICVDGKEYEVVTDYRDWLQFADMITDTGLTKLEKTRHMGLWLLTPPDVITEGIVNGLQQFYAAKGLEYERTSDDNDIKDNKTENEIKLPVFSWKIDARYVLGDFRRFYNINLLDVEYMHWWEFRALFDALPDDSNCHKRILYRGVNLSEVKNTAERERIGKIQRQIALPFEYSDDAIGEIFGGML